MKKTKRQLQPTFLKQWRESIPLRQEEAASRLGISRTLLSKIENGKSPYSQGLLEAAAEAYGTSVASLLIRDPSKPNAVWDIQERLLKAPPAKREEVLSVVEVMLTKTGT